LATPSKTLKLLKTKLKRNTVHFYNKTRGGQNGSIQTVRWPILYCQTDFLTLNIHRFLIFSAVILQATNFLHTLAEPSSEVNANNGAVLVLGSGGLVGRAVMNWLNERQFRALEVRNRKHIDLRISGALDVFNNSGITYCIFLACEVGGSKFIESSEQDIQVNIINSNLQIYQTVIPWLTERRIPFIFTSSYLQGTENSYGAIKRLGEVWIQNLGGLGKILRLWNVYGPEQVGLKSHVLSDWAHQCAKDGIAQSLTDGREVRQFVHVNDTASACGVGMLNHEDLDMISDVSSGIWVDMRQVADVLNNASGGTCTVNFSEREAGYRARLSAQLTGRLHTRWTAAVSLEEGCRALLNEYRTCTTPANLPASTAPVGAA
jgi:nucleoside-diphosphate-sugar epimerase